MPYFGGTEGFMADFPSIPGNDALRARLSSMIRSGTLGHAYIIEGETGGDKLRFDLAFAVAKALLCEKKTSALNVFGGVSPIGEISGLSPQGESLPQGEISGLSSQDETCGVSPFGEISGLSPKGESLPCNACPSCVRADAGTHPDIRVIDRGERATLGVDTVRRLKKDAYLIPSESERKVYIIKDADTMTVEAQNAFLLLLEEPPAFVLFLLLCRDSGLMLETIRSRAPALRLSPCSRPVMEEYLLREGKDAARRLFSSDARGRDELLLAAGGDPVLGLELLDGNRLSALREAKRRASELLSLILSGSDEALYTIASMKKPKRDEAAELLFHMRRALRDMLLSKKSRGFETCFYLTPDEAAEASAGCSAKKLALAIDETSSASEAIDAYASVTTTLLSMSIRIRNQ